VQFYRESEYRHPNSNNRLLFKSFGLLLNFDAFNLVPELLTQPLQVIVGGKKGNTGQYEDGEKLFKLSPSLEKEFYVIQGASHYDMYWKAEYIDEALSRLVTFYEKHL
jgi:fermentation-respiration switch protein FrsA (DUF1100 family)